MVCIYNDSEKTNKYCDDSILIENLEAEFISLKIFHLSKT